MKMTTVCCPKCGQPVTGGAGRDKFTCPKCSHVFYRELAGPAAVPVPPDEPASQPEQEYEPEQPSKLFFRDRKEGNENSEPSPKSRWIALNLVLTLGWAGAHYFYVGRKKKGFLYLCTFGLFCFGWLFDIVTTAFGNLRDEDGLKVKKWRCILDHLHDPNAVIAYIAGDDEGSK